MVAAKKTADTKQTEPVSINVKMPAGLVDGIDKVAEQNGRDRSKEIRFVMGQHVAAQLAQVAT